MKIIRQKYRLSTWGVFSSTWARYVCVLVRLGKDGNVSPDHSGSLLGSSLTREKPEASSKGASDWINTTGTGWKGPVSSRGARHLIQHDPGSSFRKCKDHADSAKTRLSDASYDEEIDPVDRAFSQLNGEKRRIL